MVVLLALSAVTGLTGNVSGWAWWFLFDTKHFVGVVAPLSEDPAVSEALARELVDQIFAAVDVQERIAEALPERAQFVAGPIAAGAQQFATDGAQRVIESEQFKEIWRTALTEAHRVALGILRDEGEVIGATDGKVSLDISAVAAVVDERLTERGFDLFDPDDLPDDVGRITLLESDQLAAAQRGVELLDRVQLWAPILTFGLWGAALGVSPNRRRTLATIGLLVAAVMAAELVALRLVRRALLDNVQDPGNLAAVESLWSDLTERLRLQCWAFLLLGLIVAGLAYVLGPSARASAIRSGTRARIGAFREGRVSEGAQDRLERLVAPRRRGIEIGLVVLAAGFLLAIDTVTPRAVLGTTLAVLLALAAVELAAGPRARE